MGWIIEGVIIAALLLVGYLIYRLRPAQSAPNPKESTADRLRGTVYFRRHGLDHKPKPKESILDIIRASIPPGQTSVLGLPSESRAKLNAIIMGQQPEAAPPLPRPPIPGPESATAPEVPSMNPSLQLRESPAPKILSTMDKLRRVILCVYSLGLAYVFVWIPWMKPYSSITRKVAGYAFVWDAQPDPFYQPDVPLILLRAAAWTALCAALFLAASLLRKASISGGNGKPRRQS